MMDSSQSSQANQARQSTHAIEANHRSKVRRALYICTLMLGVATFVFVCYSSRSVMITDIDSNSQGYKNMINAATDTTDSVVGARVLLGTLADTCDTGTWKSADIHGKAEELECVESKWQPRTCKLGNTKEDPSSKSWMLCVRKGRQQETEWKSTPSGCLKAPKWNDESNQFVASEPWIADDGKQYRCSPVGRRWERKMACAQGNTKADGSTCDSKGFYGKCENGKWKEEDGVVYQCSVVTDKLSGFSKRDWEYRWKKECEFKEIDVLMKMENGNCRFCVHGKLGNEKDKNSELCKKLQ